jgi:hypothetical protein
MTALFDIKLGKMPTFIMDKPSVMRYDIKRILCGGMPRRKL